MSDPSGTDTAVRKVRADEAGKLKWSPPAQPARDHRRLRSAQRTAFLAPLMNWVISTFSPASSTLAGTGSEGSDSMV